MKLKPWIGLGFATLLTACSVPDEAERLANLGLPPADFVGDKDLGRQLYSKNCSSCHGLMMSGSKLGPPLNHKVYEPSHHANLAFYRAVKDGVRAHHWEFGDMPPQSQVSPTDAAHIIAYVRVRQERSGIR
ncbi:MAG: cytochrome c [Halopseudomonas sp.]